MQTLITLGAIKTSTIQNGPSAGRKFSKSRAVAHFPKGDREVTVMAFGDQRDSVAKLLKKGRKATFTTIFEGHNLIKILGPQQVAPAAESAEG